MRVLHVSPYFAPAFCYGGPPRSVLGLCRALAGEGVEVQVVTTTANGEGELPDDVSRHEVFDGVPVCYLPRRSPRRSFNARGLRRALARSLAGVDLVHAHGLWNFPVWWAVRASMRASVPFAVSPRGMLDEGSFDHHRWRKEVCYLAWERRYLRRASFLHATSRSEEQRLTRLSLGPSIVRIPNGVDLPGPLSPGFRAKVGIPEGAGVVLYLGRLHPTKRLDLLLEAMIELRKTRPDAQLVVAGPNDGLDLARFLTDENRGWVRYLGEVSSEVKWDVLSEVDVLALCSNSESFGMSVVEALAAGRPAVVTRTCPWEELALERCGYWVEQNPKAIARALSNVLENPTEARAMGARGRELVKRRYRWSAVGREMVRQYHEILSRQ